MEMMKGFLQEQPLLSLLQSAENEERSGVLLVSRENRARSFFLQDGMIIACRGSMQDSFSIPGTPYQPLRQQVVQVVQEVNAWEDGGFLFTGRLPEKSLYPMDACRISDIMTELTGPKSEYASILAEIKRQIMRGEVEIPPLPDTMFKVHRYLNDENSSVSEIITILETNQVLTGTLLKVANSAFYSLANPAKNVQQALVYLGFKTVEAIVVAQTLNSLFIKNREAVRQVLRESFGCALLAKKIAGLIEINPDDAFICGLLHSIGQTLLLNLAGDYDLPRDMAEQLARDEHQEVGVLLAEEWNLPEVVVETIKNLKTPQQSKHYGALVETVVLARAIFLEPDRVSEQLEHHQNLALPREEIASLADLVPAMQNLADSVT